MKLDLERRTITCRDMADLSWAVRARRAHGEKPTVEQVISFVTLHEGALSLLNGEGLCGVWEADDMATAELAWERGLYGLAFALIGRALKVSAMRASGDMPLAHYVREAGKS
jgi:hypothetical protein